MKKWILLLAASAILLFVNYFYIAFNGNFISKIFARNIADQHIQQMFEGDTITETNSYFNFKDGRYTFDYNVYKGNRNWSYRVSVRGAFIPQKERVLAYLNEQTVDEQLTATFKKAGETYVHELLKAENLNAESVEYFVSIPQGFYKTEQSWTPAISPALMPELFVALKDEGQTKEQFLSAAQAIQRQLNDREFTYLNVYISISRQYDNSIEQREGYADIFYETLYSVQFTPKASAITMKNISPQ